jgi:hypothetical protein
LETEPTTEGLILAMSVIGGTVITTFSGPVSDRLGRRPMLIISSVVYFISGLIMLWSPSVPVLLLGRLLDGFAVGLAVTLVPVYISETAPPEIRGQLNTIPQLTGSGGMFLSYCMLFGMSLLDSPSWRLMLGILCIPSLIFFALTVFYLPESPRWLASKGRMIEAEQVLQRLRGREDVRGELALLVEGLGVGAEASIQDYIINPANHELTTAAGEDEIKLYGSSGPSTSGEGLSWVAKPVNYGQSPLGNGSIPLVDPLVSLFGSVHERFPETRSMRSLIFSNMGSTPKLGEHDAKNEEQWDVESPRDGDYQGFTSDDNLNTPLLSRQTTDMDNDMNMAPAAASSHGEAVMSHADIGGGWKLVWKWSEKVGEDGKKEGGFQRIYLHQEAAIGSRHGSLLSVPSGAMPEEGEFFQADVLVSQPALSSKALISRRSIGPATPETVVKGPSNWSHLLVPGVKRALFVGVGLQMLQQVKKSLYVLLY